MNRGRYIDELRDTLAGKLNSNEDFHPDRGLQIDVVLVRMPTNGFEHVYQTTEFTVKEFREGSTRLDTLMRKLAGKLNWT